MNKVWNILKKIWMVFGFIFFFMIIYVIIVAVIDYKQSNKGLKEFCENHSVGTEFYISKSIYEVLKYDPRQVILDTELGRMVREQRKMDDKNREEAKKGDNLLKEIDAKGIKGSLFIIGQITLKRRTCTIEFDKNKVTNSKFISY